LLGGEQRNFAAPFFARTNRRSRGSNSILRLCARPLTAAAARASRYRLSRFSAAVPTQHLPLDKGVNYRVSAFFGQPMWRCDLRVNEYTASRYSWMPNPTCRKSLGEMR
jgi:hypothetical protein